VAVSKVLVLSDLQCPFDHNDYLAFVCEVYRHYGITEVVNIGDEIDHHALGDFDCDPDGYSAGHELDKAVERLTHYYKAFPRMKLCESNHTSRILKRAFKSGIPVAYMRNFKEVINAPKNWHWGFSWEIDRVVYKHGLGYSGTLGALNAAKDELKSCVIGHLHADAGILFWSNGKEVLFGMNVGSAIDQKAYAFNYSRHSRKKAVLSCGVVIDGAPHLIVMNLKNGRWDGKI
jgi:hypothetical protein